MIYGTNESALDHNCDKSGCAAIILNPKLREFDNCFPKSARMGDVDGTIERNGHILWMEWKSRIDKETFEKTHCAQFWMAQNFTKNSKRQTFVFVAGDPRTMDVSMFRIIYGGKWRSDDWRGGGTPAFKGFLSYWFRRADKRQDLDGEDIAPWPAPV